MGEEVESSGMGKESGRTTTAALHKRALVHARYMQVSDRRI